jgi:flagellar biosynthetic protein FliO
MDTIALVGRLLVSLAAVLGVMWLIARRMRRGVSGKDSRLIDVLERQQLSRTASVSVIRVMDQALVIGVTDSQVRLLAEIDLVAVRALLAASASSGSPRRSLRSRKTRKEQSQQPDTYLPSAPKPTPRPAPKRMAIDLPDGTKGKGGALAGSALSRHTWKQTLESLRDLTTRS